MKDKTAIDSLIVKIGDASRESEELRDNMIRAAEVTSRARDAESIAERKYSNAYDKLIALERELLQVLKG